MNVSSCRFNAHIILAVALIWLISMENLFLDPTLDPHYSGFCWVLSWLSALVQMMLLMLWEHP